MKCPKCEKGEMESMGYGDTRCSECGYSEYMESEEDFAARMNQLQAVRIEGCKAGIEAAGALMFAEGILSEDGSVYQKLLRLDPETVLKEYGK